MPSSAKIKHLQNRHNAKRALKNWKGGHARAPRGIKHNMISSRVSGAPNKIMTQRTHDAGVISLAGTKHFSSTNAATSATAFNFPNFSISQLPSWKEWSAMFGRFKLYALEIRLIPVYSYTQTITLDSSAPSTPNNASCNMLITRMSTKYDTSPNADRFDATYAEDDIKLLDQFVKKKTIVVTTRNFKGFKSYTKRPRQMDIVAQYAGDPITTTQMTLQNVPGKWNDFDSGENLQYTCNDTIYIRNADPTIDLPPLITDYRVIYKAFVGLSGFQ